MEDDNHKWLILKSGLDVRDIQPKAVSDWR
jgi:hypothetical protein